MAASASDYFIKTTPNFSTTIGSGGVASAIVTTIPLSSVTNLPTDTAIEITINRIDTDGDETNNYETVRGIISGSNLIDCVRGVEGTAQAWNAGIVVEVLVTADIQNRNVTGILVEHNQTGTHKGTLVTTLKATAAEVATGTDDTKIVTPKGIKDATGITLTSPVITGADIDTPFYVGRQAIINGGFTVNQRVYISNAVLAAGAYGHDRWKAGAGGGDYTFTQLAQSTVITIKAAKTLIQVVEDKNVIGGTYTLSWEGTAQARFGIDSATPSGDYAASPITITGQTAGTVMSVEFNAGTLSNVQLNSGSVALPFQPKSFGDELIACCRFCFVIEAADLLDCVAPGMCDTTTRGLFTIALPTRMRQTPSLTATASDWIIHKAGTNIDVTNLAGAYLSPDVVVFLADVASGLTAGEAVFLGGDGGGTRLMILNAEL